MKRLIALLVPVLLMAAPIRAETLVFAPLPMETPLTVAGQWKPLLTYLEQTLGVTIRIDYSASNEEVLDKFRAGRLDLAYLGPLPYVVLKKGFPAAEPVVIFHEKNGQPTYTCAIAMAADTKLPLKGLRGRKIALTQPMSTCGYIASQGLLQRAGTSLEANRFRYLGPHDEVALAVVRGDFDAGGLKSAIAGKYAHLGLKVTAESPPFPGLALVANRGKVSAARIKALQQALLDADPKLQEKWGDNIRNGVSPAKDSDFDGVRQLPIPVVIPPKGNF